MSVLKFKDAFVKMSPRKRAIIRDYCRIYEDASLNEDALVERISRIWTRASGHSDLLACLQLVDYIYADAGDKEIDDDIRVYLCEHLGDEVGLNSDSLELVNTAYPHNVFSRSKGEPLLVQCEDGGYTTVVKNISDFSENWKCSQCHQDFSRHKVVLLEGALPDA